MKFKLFSLLALLLGFIGGAFLLNQLGSSARLDLTEQKLYTLSEGTRNILAQLEQPVELELYFSQKASADLVKVRAYQQRVRELLDEYVMVGKMAVEKSTGLLIRSLLLTLITTSVSAFASSVI